MKTNILIITALSVLLSTISCRRYRCIEGNGSIRTETRDLSYFDGVVSNGDYDVYVVIDTSLSTPQLEITTDENLMSYIETKVIGDDLIIETYDDRCFKTERPPRITVTAPDMYLFELDGAGLISCNAIERDQIQVNLFGSGMIEVFGINAIYVDANHDGSGEIELHGRAINADYGLYGSGRIQGTHLELDICDIELEGSGDIYVWAWDKLIVDLSGSGFVYYIVRPLILDPHITGSGDILPFPPGTKK